MALSSPTKLTSSASFSPSIRISLRLKIHQAQAKNFCRVLDIRVTQIVKAHPAQTVTLQKFRKCVGQVFHPHPLAQLIHKDITVIFVVVAVAADLFVDFLCRFYFFEILRKAADKRKCTHTGFCFCRVLCVHFCFSVHLQRCDRVPYGYCATLKVDSIPFQAHHLATAKSVKGSHQHRQLQLGSPKGFKHLLHLVRREKDRLKAVLSGPVHLVRHILDQHIGLDCIFQCRVNDGVIMDNGIGRDPPEHFRINICKCRASSSRSVNFFLRK